MSAFEIVQIGDDCEPTAGLKEACDLCGHCRMMRRIRPDGRLLAGGAARPDAAAGRAGHRPYRSAQRPEE